MRLLKSNMIPGRGYKAMVTINYKNKAVPFGAVVTLEDENLNDKERRSSIVGDAGQVYITGLPKKGAGYL